MKEQMLKRNISHYTSFIKSPSGKSHAPAIGAKHQVGISVQSERTHAPLPTQSVCEMDFECLLNQVDVRTGFAYPIKFIPKRFDRTDILS